jgi:hypothetical protein
VGGGCPVDVAWLGGLMVGAVRLVVELEGDTDFLLKLLLEESINDVLEGGMSPAAGPESLR